MKIMCPYCHLERLDMLNFSSDYLIFELCESDLAGFFERIMIIQNSKSGLFSSNFFVISGESGFSGS